MQALEAFASGINSDLLGIRLVFPSIVSPLVFGVSPVWVMNRRRPGKHEILLASEEGK